MSPGVKEIDRELEEMIKKQAAKIKVIGIGGGGNNSLNRMGEIGIKGGELIAIMPEGHSATVKEGYRLWKFYPGVIKLHLRYKVPIIPTAIMGCIENAPIWGYDYNPDHVPPWDNERQALKLRGIRPPTVSGPPGHLSLGQHSVRCQYRRPVALGARGTAERASDRDPPPPGRAGCRGERASLPDALDVGPAGRARPVVEARRIDRVADPVDEPATAVGAVGRVREVSRDVPDIDVLKAGM